MLLAGVRAPRLLAAAVLLLGAAGCGPRLYAVRGKVAYADGRPVTEGMVVFESAGAPAVTARGDIQPDGSFELSTYRPHDGVPAGKYHVLVSPHNDPNAVDRPPQPPPFDLRYADFKTSGLEFDVTGDKTDYPIQVTPPGQPRR